MVKTFIQTAINKTITGLRDKCSEGRQSVQGRLTGVLRPGGQKVALSKGRGLSLKGQEEQHRRQGTRPLGMERRADRVCTVGHGQGLDELGTMVVAGNYLRSFSGSVWPYGETWGR